MNLLDRAVKMVAELDEPVEMNFVRKHAPAVGGARRDAARRGHPRLLQRGGSYSANVGLAIENGGWEDEGQLQDQFLSRKGFAFNADKPGVLDQVTLRRRSRRSTPARASTRRRSRSRTSRATSTPTRPRSSPPLRTDGEAVGLRRRRDHRERAGAHALEPSARRAHQAARRSSTRAARRLRGHARDPRLHRHDGLVGDGRRRRPSSTRT